METYNKVQKEEIYLKGLAKDAHLLTKGEVANDVLALPPMNCGSNKAQKDFYDQNSHMHETSQNMD